MGCKKFYESPEGKVRANLLAASGMQYDRDSVEYRLLEMHTMRESSYRFHFDSWLADSIMHIFAVSSVAAGIQEEARNKLLDYSGDRFRKISDLVNPFKSFEPEQSGSEKGSTKKATDADRTRYLQALGRKGGYKSLPQLMRAVHALNKTIEDMQYADTAPTATDD